MDHFKPTPKTRLRRLPKRGSYDRKVVEAILDEGLIAHVGFVAGRQPFVIPLIYGRKGGRIYFHGSSGGRALRALKNGTPVCATVTLIDGLVLARSLFHHSMNYRCVVVVGQAKLVGSDSEKAKALKIISDHLLPGRWEEARKPNRKELAQTSVVSLDLIECSAKIRTGPPTDEKEDYALPVWAGVIPVRTIYEEPIPDAGVIPGLKPRSYLKKQADP